MPSYFLMIVGSAYGAIFIWLVVQIINRPSEWLGVKLVKWLGGLALPVAVAVLLMPVERSVRPAGRRSSCKNNLKQIGLALHNYHEMYGCIPPAYVNGPDGKPWHSWRVLILPQLDRQALYDAYRFDEPWDGPNNRQLADNFLSVFNCPSDARIEPENSKKWTSYVAVVGSETAWPNDKSVKFGDFRDGLAKTIIVAEIPNSGIHWMEPRDLHVLQMAPTINAKSGQGIASRHQGGAFVVSADGSVRFAPDRLSAEDLRAWLTINGGESPNDF